MVLIVNIVGSLIIFKELSLRIVFLYKVKEVKIILAELLHFFDLIIGVEVCLPVKLTCTLFQLVR
jgi:hypothetical protein